MQWTCEQVAGMIDHTNLKPYATREDFRKLCEEAVRYGFKSVAINTYPVRMCREFLEGSGVLTGAAIAFPLGQMTVESKVQEARNAIADGCQEFDYVLNIGKFKEHDDAYIEDEMHAMVQVAHEADIICKVIFETCYLDEAEIVRAAEIASRVRPDFVKTSTGFGTSGATPAHVALMKRVAGEHVQVKAAGGIRTWAEAREMLEAGATRLGTSSGIRIIEEMRAQGLR